MQKIEYIHNNPVRAGLVRKPEDYRYNSAYDFVSDAKPLLELSAYDGHYRLYYDFLFWKAGLEISRSRFLPSDPFGEGAFMATSGCPAEHPEELLGKGWSADGR